MFLQKTLSRKNTGFSCLNSGKITIFATHIANIKHKTWNLATTVAVVGVMFVVVAGLTYTDVLHWMIWNLLGLLTMIALRRLLPERKAPEAAFESTGDYTVELLVPSDNPYIAKRVGPLGLNNVVGGSLIELRHFDDDKIMSPVPDKEPLMGGDRLVYAGQIEELLELKKKYGLVSADHYVFHYSEVDTSRQLRTAYITFGSSLINTRIGNGSFERDNNVTLVAVARRGKRIEQAPREVVLQAGDTPS